MSAGADGLRKFFVDALTGALDLGLAVPDDVLRHVTPDVLAAHLPRTLWGKLIAACLAAPRTDARLIVDTIGVPALCEHVPGSILWGIVVDVATRALGKGLVAAPPPPAASASATAPVAAPVAVAAPAPAASAVPTPIPAVASSPVPVAVPTVGTAPVSAPIVAPVAPVAPPKASVPAAPTPRTSGSMAAMKVPTPTPPASVTAAAARAASATVTTTAAPPPSAVVDIDFDDDDDDEPAPLDAPPVSPHRATTVAGPGAARGTPPPAAQPGNGRTGTSAGASSRRPQASAASSPKAGGRTMPASPRRGPSTSDFDLDTDVGTATAKPPEDVPVDDDQLIDWATSEETVTSGDNPLRKR